MPPARRIDLPLKRGRWRCKTSLSRENHALNPVVYWLKLRVILAKENDLDAFIKELFMKKIITAVAMASLLSGCQLLEQLQGS